MVARINRKLAKQGKAIRKTRGKNHELGEYYAIDTLTNTVLDTHVSVGRVAYEMGLIGESEVVEL